VNEAWKPVTRFPGYEASDLGRVRNWKVRNATGGDMISYIAAAILSLCSMPGGGFCEQLGDRPAKRARELASVLFDAAESHHIDPFMLTALAFRESSFDQSAVSAAASFGLLQVNARGWGRVALSRCLVSPEDCLRSQVQAGAEALAHYARKCGPDARAVAAYRHGHCVAPRDIDHQVIATRNALHAKWGKP
jgi:hypothetical protein